MAKKKNGPTARRKGRNGDGGQPVTFPDSSAFNGNHPGAAAGSVFTHTPKGFTKISGKGPRVVYQVCAVADEQSVIDEVDVPGIDPDDISLPWSILLGNGVIVRANGDDVVELIFPSQPDEHDPDSETGKPTALSLDASADSAAVISNSNGSLVHVFPKHPIIIHLASPAILARRFKREGQSH